MNRADCFDEIVSIVQVWKNDRIGACDEVRSVYNIVYVVEKMLEEEGVKKYKNYTDEIAALKVKIAKFKSNNRYQKGYHDGQHEGRVRAFATAWSDAADWCEEQAEENKTGWAGGANDDYIAAYNNAAQYFRRLE